MLSWTKAVLNLSCIYYYNRFYNKGNIFVTLFQKTNLFCWGNNNPKFYLELSYQYIIFIRKYIFSLDVLLNIWVRLHMSEVLCDIYLFSQLSNFYMLREILFFRWNIFYVL